MSVRVMPLPKVTGIWDRESSQYPDRIRIPMSDGTVVTYRIDVEMPHPAFIEAMDGLWRMRVGYRAKHAKK